MSAPLVERRLQIGAVNESDLDMEETVARIEAFDVVTQAIGNELGSLPLDPPERAYAKRGLVSQGLLCSADRNTISLEQQASYPVTCRSSST